ncbi:MAG TPA: hypothetical protein VHN39_06755, partial [Phenylobacterium sp.]|nr:hypothetical protein [Phenylobacterium sp.]
MRTGHKLSLLAGATIMATAAVAQPAQKVTGPIAVYWMSASTQSGFGMPGMSGGGRPSMSQIMGMVNGGGGAQHSLTLQLGSTQKPTGAPNADHLPPQTLGAGPSLPLVTPEPPPPSARPEPEEQPAVPREYQKPKGKMLIFWGCGEHAKPGQPLVIDFAQMGEGKLPAGMEMLGKGFGFRPMQPPSARRYATYGEWPNAQSRTTVPSEGSLVGPHSVQGDYSPAIKFNLGATQDFLGPLTLTTNTKTPGGPAQLGWAAVSGAQAYAATVIGASQEGRGGRGGGNQDPTVVLWSSSETQAAAFALPDYISPGDLARGVESHALMGPSTTSCLVPKEVVDASPQGLLQMAAYGGEANFVYPPRPTDPKITWNQQWQVKVRYRSAT